MRILHWKKNKLSLSLLAFVLLGVFLTGSIETFAQSSEIRTTICDVNTPSVTVTSPINHSIVATDTILLSGLAKGTTGTVDIYNGSQLVATAQIGYTGSFSIPLKLTKGENIFKIHTIISCSMAEQIQEFYITYGTLPSGQTGGLAKSNKQKAAPATDGSESKVERIKEKLGLSSDGSQDPKIQDSSFVKPMVNWLAVILLLVALLVALYPSIFTTALSAANKPRKKKLLRSTRTRARILSILLVVILAFLLQS